MKKWILSLLLIIAVFLFTGVYLFYKKPADIRKSKADFELTASELSASYVDEDKANAVYLGKVLAVRGTIASIEEQEGNWTVFLETGDPLTGITCSFYVEEGESLKKLRPGEDVVIQGECTGKLTDIVLNHCSIVTQTP